MQGIKSTSVISSYTLVNSSGRIRANKSQYKEHFLRFSLPLLWICVVSVLWLGEEPSRMQTVVLLSFVCVLVVFIINLAKKRGIIKSETTWLIAILVKMTITLLIVKYAWIEILPQHRALGDQFDPVRYDYYGKLYVESSLDYSVIPQVRYPGVMLYIGFIYLIFGVSTFYVALINCVLSLGAFLVITALLVRITQEKRPWQWMFLGLYFPDALYFDSLPSKETLTMFFFALSLYALYRVFFERSISSIGVALISVITLWFIRAPAAVAVLVIFGLWIILACHHGRIPYLLIFILSFFIITQSWLWTTIYPEQGIMEALNPLSRIPKGTNTLPTYLTVVGPTDPKSINKMLMPRSIPQFIAFAPLRAIAYLIIPFPFWTIQWNTFLGKADSYVVWLQNFCKFSVIILLISSPALIAATIDSSSRRYSAYKLVVLGFWVALAIVANGMFVFHERFRSMLTPLWLATVLIGIHRGNPRKYVPLIIILIPLGIALYYIQKRLL